MLARLDAEGCARYVVTDVGRDGTMTGPNLALLESVCAATDRPVVASGGIATLDDIARAPRDWCRSGSRARSSARRSTPARSRFALRSRSPEGKRPQTEPVRERRGPGDPVPRRRCRARGEGRAVRRLRDAGDPVEMAALYDREGADELVFLDVTASSDGRETTYDVVRRTAEQVFIPLTVGGGVRAVADVDRLLRAGADKVGGQHRGGRPAGAGRRDRRAVRLAGAHRLGRRPALPGRLATPSGFEVTTHGGRRGTGLDAVAWAAQVAELGAGEILLNSIDADGTEDGYDLAMMRPSAPRSPCRWSPAAAPARSSTSPRPSMPAPTRCSRPASSTSARCGSPTSRRRCARPGSHVR